MKSLKILIPVAATLLFAGQAAAQNEQEAPERAEAAERQKQAEVAEAREAVEFREAEIRRRLADAEQRMAEAARQIAELTSERLPQIQRHERRIEIINSDRPRLGVAIGGDDKGPVEGVQIVGVTPGTAAADAGLRAGDIITSVNDESLSADNSEQANERLLDFMQGVEEGDTLDLEYLRDGKVGSVQVEPRISAVNVFAFGGPDRTFRVPAAPDVQVAPHLADGLRQHFVFDWTTDGLGDMELIELNEGLGRYFGTEEGLLVVSAPSSDSYKLEDGDVIQKIDGRTPSSVRHAMRILGSYQAGESLELEIMRDKKRRTIAVEIPDDRTSRVVPGPAPVVQPAAAPVAPTPRLATPLERT